METFFKPPLQGAIQIPGASGICNATSVTHPHNCREFVECHSQVITETGSCTTLTYRYYVSVAISFDIFMQIHPGILLWKISGSQTLYTKKLKFCFPLGLSSQFPTSNFISYPKQFIKYFLFTGSERALTQHLDHL